MGQRDRLRQALLEGQIPTEAKIVDVIVLYQEIGWTPRKPESSHYSFTKPGKRSLVVSVHGGKVNRAALNDLARAMREAEGE